MQVMHSSASHHSLSIGKTGQGCLDRRVGGPHRLNLGKILLIPHPIPAPHTSFGVTREQPGTTWRQVHGVDHAAFIA